MAKKMITEDVQVFAENINKKDKKKNGKRITYAFTNRKRKG